MGGVSSSLFDCHCFLSAVLATSTDSRPYTIPYPTFALLFRSFITISASHPHLLRRPTSSTPSKPFSRYPFLKNFFSPPNPPYPLSRLHHPPRLLHPITHQHYSRTISSHPLKSLPTRNRICTLQENMLTHTRTVPLQMKSTRNETGNERARKSSRQREDR